MKALRLLGLVPGLLLLGGCNVVLMAPAGDVAVQQRNLLLASTGLMLLIILPVMALVLIFAWHYRASNTKAVYDPEFHHSTALEVVIWSAPLLIIIMLGALTWMGTHLLDPYRAIGRVSAARPVVDKAQGGADQPVVKPLTVEVVALDWKWLFFYPDQGIATVNELAAPVDVPIVFKITSAAVMNSFFIPALAGQIYAMPGMETRLNAVINEAGVYDGFSSNYSGSGFSRMNFKFHGLDQAGFDAWIAKVKGSPLALDRASYGALEKPSEGEPPRHYGRAEHDLYDAILNMCARPGKMCMSEMMQIDARGGGGKDSAEARERLIYDAARRQEGTEGNGATFPATGRPAHGHTQPQGMKPDQLSPDVSKGAPPSGHAGHGGPAPAPGQGGQDHGGQDHGGHAGGPAPVQLNK